MIEEFIDNPLLSVRMFKGLASIPWSKVTYFIIRIKIIYKEIFMEFNNTQITDMSNFLNGNSPVRNALVIGNKGLGKSYVIKKLISEYNYITQTSHTV